MDEPTGLVGAVAAGPRCVDEFFLGVQDMQQQIQDVMGQNFAIPDDIDEEDLMGELDALEADLAFETENPNAEGVPSYLQVVKTSRCSAWQSHKYQAQALS